MKNSKSPPRRKTLKEVNVNRSGPLLSTRLKELSNHCTGEWSTGQRVWVKATGYCDWPGVIWNLDLCLKKIIPDLFNDYEPGSVLIRFYGDQTSMWCSKSSLKAIDDNYDRRCRAMRQWSKRDKKRENEAHLALEELETSSNDVQSELKRMLQLQNGAVGYVEGTTSFACTLCGEDGAKLKCRVCERHFHPLCLTPAALTPSDLPNGGHWFCPSCGEENHVTNDSALGDEEKVERMGLTPDWIIHAGAFKVFQLQEPTVEYPYIRGLLDPCTNSKVAPNIPAEVIYDKNDDGLKRCNSWEGYHIVLNPDFKAQIQWRFVNRAIDEVENDRVPGVLLICRNSTDTAYFQRLMPYPRVLLRRNSIRFKDYDKTPIGFGIVVFCIVKRQFSTIITRFLEQFAKSGEPNIVMDKEWLLSRSFESLLDRLHKYANKNHRDHWVQCCQCGKWRIITYEALLVARDMNWECKHLNPPHSSCRMNQTKAEIMGARYAVLSEEKITQAPTGEDNERGVVKDTALKEDTGVIEGEDSSPAAPPQTSNWLNSIPQVLVQNPDPLVSLGGPPPPLMTGTQMPRESVNVKLVYVDLSIFNGLFQFIHNASSLNSNGTGVPLSSSKRQLEDSNEKEEEETVVPYKKPRHSSPSLESTPSSSKMSIDDQTPDPKGKVLATTGVKREANGEVKSYLEMSREANKAALQSYVDSILIRKEREDAESSLHEAQIQEAERAVENAKQQVIDALNKETQIKKERIQLEAEVKKKLQDFVKEEEDAEEFLQFQQQRMMTVQSAAVDNQ